MSDMGRKQMSVILKEMAMTTLVELVAYKRRHYPHDKRKVVACGAFDNKIRVEWTD